MKVFSASVAASSSRQLCVEFFPVSTKGRLCWFPDSEQDYEMTLSLFPDSREELIWWDTHMIKWNRKRERSQGRSMEAPTAKREKVEKNLEIDGNSRKIVASANGATLKSSGDETDRNHFQEKVEEVQWESSQPWQLSASQLTQNDPGDGIVIPPSVEAQAPKSQRLPSDTMSSSEAQHSEEHALDGIGNQGGRIHIQGGGGLKTSQIKQTRTKERTRIGGKDNAFGLPSPISFMSVETHIQCRTGASRLDAETSSQKRIAFTPNPTKDRVYGIVFIHGRVSLLSVLTFF